MNKKMSAILLAAFVLFGVAAGQAQTKVPEGRVSISGAWALYPMVVKWAEEYQKLYPQVKIDVQAGGAGKGIADAIAGMVDFGMVSRDVHPSEIEKGAFPIPVTKDAVVPMINVKNPCFSDILSKGLTQKAFTDIWINKTVEKWSDVVGGKVPAPIHVFTRSDACGAAETWAAFLGKRQEDLTGVGVYGDPGLADAVQRDPLGIGFNNVNFAYDPKTLLPVAGLSVAPIDLDGNGKIDPAEQFYKNRDELTKAIAEGRYPSPPARDLYMVSKGAPTNPAAAGFLRWILTDGQKFVTETGYIQLSPEKLATGLEKLK
ncbi:MAG: PstS family phosphate ABC transporter substrate-binding protein [Candidatus Aminicenantales bacterium]